MKKSDRASGSLYIVKVYSATIIKGQHCTRALGVKDPSQQSAATFC
jgi:hypothetical protein